MKFTCRLLLAVSLAVAMVGVRAQLLPPAAFFRNPAFASASLSPDGKLIAALVPGASGRLVLAVFDPADFSKSRIVAALADADVGRLRWVSDRRLVFSAIDLASGGGEQDAPGLYAVDADGSDFRQLADRNWRGFVTGGRSLSDRSLPWYTFFEGTTRSRTNDDIFVTQVPYDRLSARPGREAPSTALFRLNTRAVRLTSLSASSSGSVHWGFDANDQPRVMVVDKEGRTTIHYRDPDADKWREVAQAASVSGASFRVLALRDGSTAIVWARRGGGDTSALYLLDAARGVFDEQPLVSVRGFDFSGSILLDPGEDNRLLGMHFESDAPGTVWLHPGWREVQAAIDAALPGRANRLHIAARPQAPYVLVESASDTQPPVFYLYDSKERRLTQIAKSFPEIDPAQMARTRFVRFKARDGMEIPMYVTAPRGAEGKKLPTVVLVHGGPHLRGHHWTWEPESQFLASRGYLVLRPDFRGSTGYGFKHFQAGWKQWGLAMQDDLADAARWAIAEGIGDPQRICIAGASYGGYAAMMGLAKDGDLFRCGVNWVGVTDLELMFTANWTDVTESARRYSLAVTLGDPNQDARQLRETSPVNLTQQIRGPVLLAYGAADLRVPIEHGRKFRSKLAETNKDVEWVVYGDEGHGWVKLENRVDFWTRVEKFLDRNIGSGAK
ncbi:MAG: alpha/beta hydrolase family protein [Betaproteobacteria bacterium]